VFGAACHWRGALATTGGPIADMPTMKNAQGHEIILGEDVSLPTARESGVQFARGGGCSGGGCGIGGRGLQLLSLTESLRLLLDRSTPLVLSEAPASHCRP
jgi:hypothetical protein